MIGRPLNSGDAVVLGVFVVGLARILFWILSAFVDARDRSPLGRVSNRVATGIVVRSIGGRLGRIGRSFDAWN